MCGDSGFSNFYSEIKPGPLGQVRIKGYAVYREREPTRARERARIQQSIHIFLRYFHRKGVAQNF